jgi:hypothetical protein
VCTAHIFRFGFVTNDDTLTQDIQSNLLDILWCHKAASFDKGVRSGSQDQVDTCPGSGVKWDKGAQFRPVVVAGVAGGENQEIRPSPRNPTFSTNWC